MCCFAGASQALTRHCPSSCKVHSLQSIPNNRSTRKWVPFSLCNILWCIARSHKDLGFLLMNIHAHWVIDHRIQTGVQSPDGRVHSREPKIIRCGDFVDVLAAVEVVKVRSRHGPKTHVMLVPLQVVRLKTSVEASVSPTLQPVPFQRIHLFTGHRAFR